MTGHILDDMENLQCGLINTTRKQTDLKIVPATTYILRKW